MSRNDWESGTIKLPAAEFAKVRQAVQNADKAHKERVFALTQEFWKSLTRAEQTNAEKFKAALHRWSVAHRPVYSGYGRVDERLVEVIDAAASMIESPLYRERKVRRITIADMHYPTNRTTAFYVNDGHITFDKATNTVAWGADGNHGVERARESAVGTAFFAALKKVRWARNTGGHFTGNDEYNQENREHGGGANYITAGFGPIGADGIDTWARTDDYYDSKGTLVRAAAFAGRKAQEKAWKAMTRRR